MKDDTSTPITDGSSPNDFEGGKPGTTARSQAEAAIEELRLRGGVFVNAVRATRMPMLLTDPNLPGNPIVFANKAFLKLSGYRMGEVLGQQPHFMDGPGTDPKDAARFAEALRSDQDDIIEAVQYRKNGSRFVATVLISAFKDEQGHTLNHFMSWLDVTRRVEAEGEVADLKTTQSALRESETRHRLLVENWSQALWETDADGVVVTDSPSWRAYTGQTLDECLGYGWLDAIHPEDRAYAKEKWREAVGARRNLDAEFRMRAPDGTCRWTNVRAAPVLDERGAIEKWAGMNIDIDARKRAEEALRESERHANVLLAELQHRVRNTLAVVRSIARRTAQNSTTAEDMLGLFQGRLDAFSRVQAALTRSPDARVDLAALIEDELVAHAARDGEQVHVSGPAVSLEARAAERLSLAIHELATNAVKHGALMGNHGRIDISWKKRQNGRGSELVLTWKESGLDIDGREIAREGFGMELLRRSLPYDLQAETEAVLEPNGLRFELRLQLPSEAASSGS